jgi:hypothetical protein
VLAPRGERARVLLLADECTGCLAAVRGLRAGGYEPWVAVSHDHTYAARSRAAAGVRRLPEPEPAERYAERVAELVRELGVVAVLPGTTASLAALTEREHLLGGAAVGTCGEAAFRRAIDRDELARLAVEAGTRTLSTSVGEMLASRAGGANGEAELCAVSGVALEGRPLSILHQNATRVWATSTGTAAFCQTRQPKPEREAVAAGILEALRWSGIFHFPFVDTPQGLWLVGFTPHVWGSFALAHLAGHNLAAAWVDQLLGREPDLGSYRAGVALRIEERDYLALLAEALGGAPWQAISKLRPRRDVHNAVLSAADPAPAFVLGRNLARAAARRARRRRGGSS